jgi:hypothetical protein
MNAGRVLRKVGYDTDALRVQLAPIDPDRVNIYPASPMMRRLWLKGIQGVTIRHLVFVDREVMLGDPERLARLVIHELVHVRQFNDAGYLGFMARYVRDYAGGLLMGKKLRQAYLDVEAEQEARALTAELVRAAK